MISENYIRTYCLNKFTDNYRLSGDGVELIIPSIFIDDDYKRHFSINLETGLWRCFKTGNKGNFIKLYSILENCPYRKAYEKFLFESFLQEEKEVEPEKKIDTLEDTSSFEKLDMTKVYDNVLMATASEFVYTRKMDNFEFYVAKEGFYKSRLIIPFFNGSGKLFYFQARALDKDGFPKYLNCKTLKSSHVLYPFNYEINSPLFITEGVFDCLALRKANLQSTTVLSCNVSKEQMLQLKHYPGELIVAFDSDEAGKEGTARFLSLALKHKISNLFTTSLKGTKFKDWNEALISKGNQFVLDTALGNIQELTRLSLAVSGL
jgi:hypothetical protein